MKKRVKKFCPKKGEKFSMMTLAECFKSAYRALPEAYKSDPKALEFYVDPGMTNNVFAYYSEMREEYMFSKGKWIRVA